MYLRSSTAFLWTVTDCVVTRNLGGSCSRDNIVLMTEETGKRKYMSGPFHKVQHHVKILKRHPRRIDKRTFIANEYC